MALLLDARCGGGLSSVNILITALNTPLHSQNGFIATFLAILNVCLHITNVCINMVLCGAKCGAYPRICLMLLSMISAAFSDSPLTS